MCKNWSNFILPMKGVSDNNAPKKIKSKGKQSELKKPLQVLQLNKKISSNDTSKISSTKDKPFRNADDSNSTQQKNHELEIEKSKTNLLEKEFQNRNAEQSTLILNNLEKPHVPIEENKFEMEERSVDDFDFDEDQFLAALNENEPTGLTGETIGGKIIALESDGLYIDIGGKAPGYMPKKECGLGVITNFKEKFPIGLEMEVLVIKE